MVNLGSEIRPLLAFYKDLKLRIKTSEAGPRFKVGETLSSVASFYERLRYAVDYKKEHLLRRNAIERILKRNLWEKGEANSLVLAEALLKELTWAKYVKNNFYPVAIIKEISFLIDKYLILAREFATFPAIKKEIKWKDWLLGIASCEIEEILDPSVTAVDVLSMAVEAWFISKFVWIDTNLSDEEKQIQIAIAIHRSLMRGDEAKNGYYLLRKLFKNWNRLTLEETRNRKDEIYEVAFKIRQSLKNPVQSKLYRFVQREVAAFQILKEWLDSSTEEVEKVLENSQLLTEKIEEVCARKYGEIANRINRGIVRSVVYIFLTKVIFALGIEVPYEIYFLKHLSILPILSSIVIPLLFVFLMAATIKKPGKENTRRIVDIILNFVYVHPEETKIEFSLAGPKKGLTYQIFTFIYVVVFVVLFTLVAYGLSRVGYNLVGIGIFFIFLSLILLFGYRVKFSASELNVTPKRESLAGSFATNLTLPFLDLGVWLSDKFASLNFFIVLFDFLVEAPLKNIMGILDDWGSYLRERRDEAIEIPVER